jgi:tetratricopeptide (TPR) repeat protein
MKSLFVSVLCLSSLLIAAEDLDRGIELYRKNDFAEAAAALRRAVEQEPDNARANLYLGLALVDQNKAGEAERFINKADELAPSGETKLGKARLLLEKKDYDGAEAALREADGEDVPYVRGLLALERKRFADAARDLEQYSGRHPDHAYAHYYAGMAYNGMRRPDKMLTHFEMFLRMKPDAPEARKVQSVLRSVR